MERLSVLYSGDKFSSLKNYLFVNQGEVKENFGQDYETIIRVLKEVRGNRSEAARRLGVSRTTLWRKLRERGSKI